MPDLGTHAIFIIAAYGVTFVTIAALCFAIVEDDRRQRRILAELERRGIRRRSATTSKESHGQGPALAKPRSPRSGRRRS
jgi:heme exporter protein D